MPVTAEEAPKRRPEPRAKNLEFVVDFLNFDFESRDIEELANSRVHLLLYGLNKPGALETAKKIQAEVRDDVLPLIAAEESLDPSDAYLLLDRFVGKVNKLRIVPEWGLEPVDYHVAVDDTDPRNLKPLLVERDDDDHANELFTSGLKALKMFGARWVVSTKVGFVGPGVTLNTEALRYRIYGAIIKSLEDGSFSKFHRCKECKRFFVGKRDNQVFCGDSCSAAYFNRDAKQRRVPELRARKRREKELKARELARKQAQQAEERAYAKFKEFVRLVRKDKHTEPELERLRPMLKRLGGWPTVRRWESKTEKDIWDDLGERDKGLFYSQ